MRKEIKWYIVREFFDRGQGATSSGLALTQLKKANEKVQKNIVGCR